MRDRPFTVAAAQAWLGELATLPPEWWKDLPNQLDLMDTFNYYRGILSEPLQQQIKVLFAKMSGVPLARVDAIFMLETVEEVRRAIQWEGPQPVLRDEPGSHLYPTDGWIGQYLHYSQGSEIPMAWHFWFGVALIGAALRRNTFVDMGTFYVYPYWYLMVIEDTASAKSTAFGVATDLIGRSNAIVRAEGRIDAIVQEASASSSLGAFLDKIKTVEFTLTLPSGRQRAGKTESCVIVPVDELVTLLGKSNFNPGEWVQFLTAIFGWSKQTYTDSKVIAGERVLYRPAISFWGGSTSAWLKNHVTEEMFQGGFLGRFVFIKRRGDQKEIAFPPPLDPVWANQLASYLADLQMMTPREFEFRRVPAVKAWMEDWYTTVKAVVRRWEGDSFQAYWKRKQSHLVRLVMCMCIAEERWTATVADCELAEAILASEEEDMGWIFSDLGAHPDKVLCDKILQYVETKRGEWVPKSDITYKLRTKVGNVATLDRLLGTLVASGELERALGSKGGFRFRLAKPIARAPSGGLRLVAGMPLPEEDKGE